MRLRYLLVIFIFFFAVPSVFADSDFDLSVSSEIELAAEDYIEELLLAAPLCNRNTCADQGCSVQSGGTHECSTRRVLVRVKRNGQKVYDDQCGCAVKPAPKPDKKEEDQSTVN